MGSFARICCWEACGLSHSFLFVQHSCLPDYFLRIEQRYSRVEIMHFSRSNISERIPGLAEYAKGDLKWRETIKRTL